ncbi:MAG: GDP-mannose 4,6-dehydratase [Candidatus Riflebacteria bacterium]|nr:GDP-mannose 4,6-dehydratase [Candidatus Riflebacteria bacterium]
MQKILITGFSGFVAKHFLDFLERMKIRSHVLGIDVFDYPFKTDDFKFLSCTFEKVDLLEREKIENLIFRFQPEFVLHLASFSSVAFSWREPVTSFMNNTNIFLNLVEAIRRLNLKTRILSVGSSEEYGTVAKSQLPFVETNQLFPNSPYAVARVAQENLSQVYVKSFSQDILLTRSFNHFGPGQKEIFVVSGFAKQLVELKRKKKAERILLVGDISIVRDFVDVRDVVSAYYELFLNGKSGEVYNVCSGKGISLKEIIEKLSEILDIEVKIQTDKNLIRPSDNKEIIGSNEKIQKEIGWTPKIPLKKSLMDIVSFWEGSM